MKRFIEGVARSQGTLFPGRLEDWIGNDNPVRAIDVFVDELDLGGLGFDRVEPLATGRPGKRTQIAGLLNFGSRAYYVRLPLRSRRRKRSCLRSAVDPDCVKT